jgi:alpha-mannosidase
MLFIAMHDAVPGTGIDEVYDEIREIFHSAENTILKSVKDCISFIARRVNVQIRDGGIIVFNSLPWEVHDWVECTLEFSEGQIRGIRNLRSERETFDIDVLHYSFHVDNSIKDVTIGFMAKVPALGFRTFELKNGESIEMTTGISRDTSFFTSNFEVKVEPETGIIHVQQGGEELFACNELRLEEELGDLYYHKDTLGLMKSETGDGIKYGAFKSEGFKVEKGKLRNVIRFKSKYYARWPYRLTEKFKPLIYRHNFVDVEKEITIYHDIDRIDCLTRIDDRHPHSRIRVQFDTAIGAGQNYWCGTQFGAIRRKADLYYNRDAKGWKEKPSGVFPSFEWIDCSNNNNSSCGISLLHCGTPSHEVRDGKLYLTLLRSIVLLSGDGIMGPCIPTPNANEMGLQTFRYSILPHRKSWRESETYRRAAEINMPLIAMQVIAAEKQVDNSERIQEFSHTFLKIEPRNILLSTIRSAAAAIGSAVEIIVRIYETEGQKTIARLHFDRLVKRVYLLDMLENELGKGTDVGRKTLEIEVLPFKVITLKVQF